LDNQTGDMINLSSDFINKYFASVKDIETEDQINNLLEKVFKEHSNKSIFTI